MKRSGDYDRFSIAVVSSLKGLWFYSRIGQPGQWKYRKTRKIISPENVFASICRFVKDEASDPFCVSPKGKVTQCTYLQVLQVDLSILSENCATAIQSYHKLDA